MKKLTTTSYILLGQLAAQPWSAYDLTKHLRRSNVSAFWPRAESHIYDEVKNLVAHKLATVKDEATGSRQRSVYSIAPKGRRALKKWVAVPGNGRLMQWEQMVKISYADYGSKDQLIAQLADMRKAILSRPQAWVALMEDDPTVGKRFPHRTHIGVLSAELMLRETRMLLDWLEWVEREVANWLHTRQSAESDITLENTFTQVKEAMKQLVEKFGE